MTNPSDPMGASPPRPSSRTMGAVHTEHVFGDEAPFAQCHAATIAARADGTVVAAWFGGTREGHPDVAIWASHRAPTVSDEPAGPTLPGAEWSAPRIIAKVSQEPHWNPVLFELDEKGDQLVLHFKVGNSIRRWITWTTQSLDGGRTWSVATPLVDGDRSPRGAVKNKPIRLRSGDWLAGSSTERWRRWDSFFDRSESGKDGWVATNKVVIDRRDFSGKGLIQPTLWQSDENAVHALFRSTAGFVYRSDSTDEGRTFGPARATKIPHNNSGLDVARLSDGTLALACNPVPGNWAARTPLSVLFSRDNGESWPERIDIESESGEFSYPALIPYRDGLAIAYTWNRRRIAFAVIRPSAGAQTLPARE